MVSSPPSSSCFLPMLLQLKDGCLILSPSPISSPLILVLCVRRFPAGSRGSKKVDVASSGRGGIVSFVGICFIAAGFRVADGHIQGGLTGDLSLMCPEFLQSFFVGQAAAGAITLVLRFITKVLFCSIACFLVLTCVLLYAFVFPRLPIVKFYRSKAALEGCLTVTADLAAGGVQGYEKTQPEEDSTFPERMSGKQILLQIVDYALDLFLIYTLSVSIVPGFVAEDTGTHSLGSWYAPVLIASFNDLVGSTEIKVG